jgi:hypothetical protein
MPNTFNPNDPDFKETNRLARKICDFLSASDESYESQMRMMFIAIGQHSFEPGKAEWLLSELRESVANLRSTVLGEPCEMGFFSDAELAAKRQGTYEVEIATNDRAIKIAIEVFAGTPLAASPGKKFARIWHKVGVPS